MAYDNLSDFIAELQDDGELARIAVEVDPMLEIAAITDRVCKSPGGGPALMFENVKGSYLPVVSNLLGSERRMCKALKANSFDEVAERMVNLIKPDLPDGWIDSLKLVPQFAQLTRLPPKTVTSGVCQQVVKMGLDVNLTELPIPQSWPADGGPTITRGQIYTRNSAVGESNAGKQVHCVETVALQVRDRDALFVHWNEHHHGYNNFRAYQQRQTQMPIAIALGGDPLLDFAAAAPLPTNTDGCLFAGFLRGNNVDMVRCRNIDLEVPAHAEIIIEGYIDTAAALESAAPIGTSTGYYGPTEQLATIRVTAITHRANPVFPVLVCGRPPTEEFWLNRATERIFLPLVKLFIPELVDLHMPRAGGFRNLLFASIRKTYPQQARKVMHAIWSLQRLMVAKMVVIVDEDVDVQNEESVWHHVGANTHPGRDTFVSDGPADMLDHAAPVRGMGRKLGIDATRKLPAEGHPREWPDALEISPEIANLINGRWAEYGIAHEYDPSPVA